jgi:hypothetical protein
LRQDVICDARSVQIKPLNYLFFFMSESFKIIKYEKNVCNVKQIAIETDFLHKQ